MERVSGAHRRPCGNQMGTRPLHQPRSDRGAAEHRLRVPRGLGIPTAMTSKRVAVPIQVVVDCRNPNALADFWAAALRYEKEWDCAASSNTDWCAVIDPAHRGPRIVFQRVGEAKTDKNRVHFDMQVGQDQAEAEVERLLAIGATRVATIEPAGPGLHQRTIMR